MNILGFARVAVLCIVTGLFSTTAAGAALRPACAVLSLADIQGALGHPFTITTRQEPTAARGAVSTLCVYSSDGKPRYASISMIEGPPELLARMKRRWETNNHAASGMRGSTLVAVRVQNTGSASSYDDQSSKKLLALTLEKL